MTEEKKETTKTESSKLKVGDSYIAGVSAPPIIEGENEYVDAVTGKSVGMFHMDVEKVTRHGVSMVRKDKWVAPKQVSPEVVKPVPAKTETKTSSK
jgi:hypothetical protein